MLIDTTKEKKPKKTRKHNKDSRCGGKKKNRIIIESDHRNQPTPTTRTTKTANSNIRKECQSWQQATVHGGPGTRKWRELTAVVAYQKLTLLFPLHHLNSFPLLDQQQFQPASSDPSTNQLFEHLPPSLSRPPHPSPHWTLVPN